MDLITNTDGLRISIRGYSGCWTATPERLFSSCVRIHAESKSINDPCKYIAMV